MSDPNVGSAFSTASSCGEQTTPSAPAFAARRANSRTFVLAEDPKIFSDSASSREVRTVTATIRLRPLFFTAATTALEPDEAWTSNIQTPNLAADLAAPS